MRSILDFLLWGWFVEPFLLTRPRLGRSRKSISPPSFKQRPTAMDNILPLSVSRSESARREIDKATRVNDKLLAIDMYVENLGV